MIAALILVFSAVFLGIFSVLMAVKKVQESPSLKIRRRLKHIATERTEPLDGPVEDLLRQVDQRERLIYRLPGVARVKRLIEQSGVKIEPATLFLTTGAVSICCFLAAYGLRRSLLTAGLAAAATVVSPLWYLRHKRNRRQIKFTEQLPDVLTMISRSLRAGHSLSAAVELVSQELPDPAGGSFKIAFDQQRLGMRMTEALALMPKMIDSLDLHFFITIVRINSETGGNLAEILDKLAETIRSRLQIRRQVQVFTAEGRMSGWVLVILPIVVFALFYLLHPGYMEPFFTNRTCQLALIGAAVGQIVGFLLIRKIINIRI